MDSPFGDFCGGCNEALRLAQLYSHMSIDLGLQKSSAHDLDRLLEVARNLKHEFVRAGDERLANAVLGIGLMLESQIAFLRVFISLKEGSESAAWDCLADAQLLVSHAVRVTDAINDADIHIRRLSIAEEVLFPRQTFMSVGFVCSSSECSICGEDYDACDHIAGRAYMGE